MADRVAALQRAFDASPDRDWPERLLAFPFSIAAAELEGEEREAIFMLDLTELGYENAKPFFEKPEVAAYQERPGHERVELAHSYARGAALLEAIRFLHGDQNIPNLMLNLETLDTQIVDLDSGAVLVSGEERALPEGKRDDCLPPEVKVPTPNGVEVDKSRWDADAERWAVGSLVGYLSLGVPPAFFLPRTSAAVIDAYAKEGPWPEIDPASPLLAPGVAATYEYWRPRLEAAPGRLVETFARFFRAGTRGADRPSAAEWVDALEAARAKPRFLSIEVTPPVAPEGTEVVLSWEAEGADRVEHAVLGELPAMGEAALAVDRSGRQTLTAVNFYGRAEASTEVVRVVPLPKLTAIPMPGFPGLELRTSIATAAPPRPVPSLPPRLGKAIEIAPAASTLFARPAPPPPPPRFGELFKPIAVPRRIRSTMRKEPNE